MTHTTPYSTLDALKKAVDGRDLSKLVMAGALLRTLYPALDCENLKKMLISDSTQ